MEDTRNISDEYKGWSEELIREDVARKTNGFSFAMYHLRDFNFGSVIRSADCLGAEEVFYVGNRRWDRRGAVGAHLRKRVTHCESFSELKQSAPYYNYVGLEVTDGAVDIRSFSWPTNPLILIGEENSGLPEAALSLCESVIQIPMYGAVRSFNAASAATLAAYDYILKRTFNG